jgi:type II secretory ATPase GspE/PulE/Tfp pilus assembly ATPase PilB-like protein
MLAEIDDAVNKILQAAIQMRTSDIHFEPQRDTLIVRFRVDGILRAHQTFEKAAQDALISKIKVLSSMNIAEHRVPQGGHFEYKQLEKIYNIRVSLIPTIYGEAIVMRLLIADDVLVRLDNLGFAPDQLELLQRLLTNRSGIILTTGPTGSGKTNLLYSILHALNKPEVNLMTLEDPVEYEIPSVRQTQINETAGVTFASALRTVVRQDPNVIMVGEIRDAETAQIAMQASLTGILVLSTFHTFDIPALANRLIEMGLSASVVAQSIVGVIATRLVRKICDQCKIPYTQQDFAALPQFVRNSLWLTHLEATMQKGQGCPTCQNTGFVGRTGIYEIVYFDTELKAAIASRQSSSVLYALLQKKNTKTLLAAGSLLQDGKKL